MTQEEKITAAINWAEGGAPKNFDPDFLYSLKDSFDQFGKFTERQEKALDNILYAFNVDLEEWNESEG